MALLLAAVLTAPCDACAEPTTADLSAIYERPGFERARERNSGAFAAYLAQARAWFLSLFETRGAQTYSNVTRVAVLVAAVLFGLVALLRRRARKTTTLATAPPLPTAPILDEPSVHRARAEALVSMDPRGAIREALFSLLASLERRRLARPERTRTNRELAEELPRNGAPPELVVKVTPLLAWFDRAFYSLSAVTPAEARQFLDDVKALT